MPVVGHIPADLRMTIVTRLIVTCHSVELAWSDAGSILVMHYDLAADTW